MLQEIDKVVQEAEALGALHESMERQKAASSAGRTSQRRKTNPQTDCTAGSAPHSEAIPLCLRSVPNIIIC
jgi:hypothetical protein